MRIEEVTVFQNDEENFDLKAEVVTISPTEGNYVLVISDKETYRRGGKITIFFDSLHKVKNFLSSFEKSYEEVAKNA